jgi:hypothetical protein
MNMDLRAPYLAAGPGTLAAIDFRTVVIASSAFRIWNGTLLTMARMKDEKRWSFLAASCSTARTAGRSR